MLGTSHVQKYTEGQNVPDCSERLRREYGILPFDSWGGILIMQQQRKILTPISIHRSPRKHCLQLYTKQWPWYSLFLKTSQRIIYLYIIKLYIYILFRNTSKGVWNSSFRLVRRHFNNATTAKNFNSYFNTQITQKTLLTIVYKTMALILIILKNLTTNYIFIYH